MPILVEELRVDPEESLDEPPFAPLPDEALLFQLLRLEVLDASAPRPRAPPAFCMAFDMLLELPPPFEPLLLELLA